MGLLNGLLYCGEEFHISNTASGRLLFSRKKQFDLAADSDWTLIG